MANTEGWVHQSIDAQKDRRARVTRYLELADTALDSLAAWFAALLKGAESPEDAIKVAVIAESLVKNHAETDFVWDAEFVLTEEGDWVSPSLPALMLPGKYEARAREVVLVHPTLAADQGTEIGTATEADSTGSARPRAAPGNSPKPTAHGLAHEGPRTAKPPAFAGTSKAPLRGFGD